MEPFLQFSPLERSCDKGDIIPQQAQPRVRLYRPNQVPTLKDYQGDSARYLGGERIQDTK